MAPPDRDPARPAPPVDPAGSIRDGVAGFTDSQPGSFRGLLANRNFRLFFASSVIASLGDWAGLFALQALVLALPGGGSRVGLFALGAVLAARVVPSLLLGPVAGVLADRYDRKRLMVFCNLVRGVILLGVAFSTDRTALFALTFINECLSLVFVASKDASLPSVVDREDLQEANQLNLIATYGSLPAGAALGAAVGSLGALFGATGIAGTRFTIGVNAVAFVVAGLLIAGLRLPARRPAVAIAGEERLGILAELRSGLDFIAGLPLIRSLILGVVGIFLGAGVVVSLGPALVQQELGRPASDWSLLSTCVGVGLVAGIVGVRGLKRFPPEKVFPWALALTGGIAAVMATLPNLTSTLFVGFFLGLAAGASFVLGYTLLQDYTPDELRGKTFATFYTANRVALFVSLAAAPLIAGTVGRVTIAVGSLGASISGLRVAILLGGLVGLTSAVYAGQGMYRAVRQPEHRAVSLPPRPTRPEASGVFITVEGVEGAGKSTQVRALVEALRAEGRDVVATREPGGPPVSERVRQIVLDPTSQMHPRTEALLYAAARAEHLQQVILPALEQGKVVVCDRYLDSSLVYQGYGRGLGPDDVLEINRWAIDDVVPDAVVLLNLDPVQGLGRVAERVRQRDAGRSVVAFPGMDRFEREDLAFHRRVAEGYLELARASRGRWVIVDASADPQTVSRQVRSGLLGWLPAVGRDGTREDDAGRASG